nr:HepT-like ribonuclease domain-containing protein [Alteribacter keqinensis]
MEKEGMLEPSLNKLMKAMVGFRNIAVHDYQELNLIILQRILENHLQDFQRYTESILKADAGE